MATQDISQLVVEVKSTGILTAANQLDKLATASDKAEAAVKKLGTAVIGSNGALSGGVAGASALATAIASLTVVMERMATQQVRASAATRNNNEAMAEAHALARGLSGSLGALWVTYGNLAGMGVGIALGASLKGVISVGSQVEQTLEQIRILGGATTGDIAKMSAAINELGKGTQGPKEVAEALQVLTLAGLNAKEAMNGVEAALNLSVAGGVGIEKSAETLVQVGTALGYTADGYNHVADVIAKAAAVSMSSVDSISGAFKSAAAVGEVYGASLQDIALGLAAVANLGIQGTSAGTALKNFYKDLSASTDKVTSTLAAMGMSISAFRDQATGGFIPLYDVVRKLDDGLNTLSPKARALAEVKLFGQQGVREGAILLKMLHEESDMLDSNGFKYANKLDEMKGEIEKGQAFSTLAAIAMAQTTTNQFKSVGNTIETVFGEVFATVQPQIGSIARTLKQAFSSEEFKSSLTTVITMFSSLTKVVVENLGALKLVAVALIGLKVLSLANDLRVAALGFDIAAVSARGFIASLGPIGIAISVLTIAWQTYKEYKDRALNTTEATDNLEEHAESIRKAADKEMQLRQMRLSGISDVEIARKQQTDEDAAASDKAIKQARDKTATVYEGLKKEWDALTENQKLRANMYMEGKANTTDRQTAGYIDRVVAYNNALKKQNQIVDNIRDNERTLYDNRKANAKFDDDKAAAGRVISPGTNELPEKGDKKGANDRYNAAIMDFENDVKAANQQLSNFRDQEDAKFKAGQIGKLQLINEVADKEIETGKRVAAARTSQRAIANATPNKQADVTRFQGDLDRANETVSQADKMRTDNLLANERTVQSQLTSMKVKALEEQGQFVNAANLKWSADGKVALEQAQADLDKYGSKFPWLSELVQQYAANRDAAMNSAQLKEDVTSFKNSMLEVESTLKGFKTATYGTSVDTMFNSAADASEKFNAKLVEAKKKRDQLGFNMIEMNTPEATQAYQEANKEVLAIGDKQKTMWQEVGQTITDSLTSAFGKSGTALGNLYKASIQYNQTENANASDRIGQYGDMAQAASGFFDKQSKGYRALNAISEVFHIAQMARTLAQTAASVVAGAANFFAQSGWGGFAGVAAMGAVLAGLGYAMSGGSSKSDPKLDAAYVQKTQGTGSVLGDADAKSESISKAMDGLKSNSDMLLPINQGMLNSLRNIESAMVGVAKLAVQNGVTNGSNFNVQTGTIARPGVGTKAVGAGAGALAGGAVAAGVGLAAMAGGAGLITTTLAGLGAALGPLGMAIGAVVGTAVSKLWGKTTQEITDSGIQLGGKIADLEAGKGVNQYAAVKTTKSSWFGLSKSSDTKVQTQGVGDEMSSQFGLIFTSLEDAMTAAAPALGASGKAVSDAIDNMVLSTKKISLKDLKGDDLTNAINSVISEAMDEVAKTAYPQMQAFQLVGEGYAQTVIRVASGVEVAGEALKKLGVSAIAYTDIVNKTGDVTYEIEKQSILAAETSSYVATQAKSNFWGMYQTKISDTVKVLSGVGDIISNMTGTADDLIKAYTDLVAARKSMTQYGLGNGLDINTIKGAGDLATLSSSLSGYYDKYFSDTEKVAIDTKDMTEKFSALGKALPSGREQLRSWIETAASTGDQLQLGKLLGLATGFDKLETELEKVGTTVEQTVDTAAAALRMLQLGLGTLTNDTLKGAGDISTLTTSLASYYDAYFTSTEKLGIETKAMTDQFSAAGHVLPSSRGELRQWIETAASTGDQLQVGKLLALVSGFDELEKSIEATADTTAAALRMIQLSVGALSEDTLKGTNGIAGLNSSLDAYYAGYFNSTEKLGIETKAMTEQFEAAGHTLPSSRGELRKWIEAAAAAGDQIQVGKLLALADGFDKLETSIEAYKPDMFSDDAVSKAKEVYDNAMSAADSAYSILETSINKQKALIQTNVDNIKHVIDTLADALKKTAPAVDAATAFKKSMSIINTAISTMNSGGDISKVAGLDDAITTVSSQTDTTYSTALDYQRSQAVANAALTELNEAGKRQLTDGQRMLATLQSQLDYAKMQLDTLKGIDTRIMTVAEALANFSSALTTAQNAKGAYDATVAGNKGGTAGAVEALYKTVLGRDSDAAGKAYWVDAIDNKGVSVTQAAKDFNNSDEKVNSTLDSLYKNVFNRVADDAGKAYWAAQIKSGVSMADVTKSFYGSKEYQSSLPSFDVGTNFVPDDMVAMIHKGERIIPAADNNELQRKLDKQDEKDSGNSDIASLKGDLAELKDAVMKGDVANVMKTNEMFKIFRDWNSTGMPPTRDT